MSFNRGMKTNSLMNRRSADSRMNKISSTTSGNNSIDRRSTLGGVNPWESGISGRGILPIPNNNFSLSSSQKQLIVDSNILVNLFSNRLKVQPQIPSLLSLETKFPASGSNFYNQQSYTQSYSHGLTQSSIKNQRFHPYNKMGTRARDDPVGRRGPSTQQYRVVKSGSQRTNGNQTEHRTNKSSKSVPAFKQIQTVRKERQDIKTSNNEKVESPALKSEKANESGDNISKDEKLEEDTEAIKDKKEKNTEDADKNTEESVTENTSEDINTFIKKDAKTPVNKSETRHAESRYAEVPMSYMFCHICDKHMWNGFSFENHLRGRAHQLMMEKLDKSYKLKAVLMRHNMRIIEEQRELNLKNQKWRGNKISVDWNVREYCTMCDLNFYGTLSMHRKNEKHQQLKTFLHPRCSSCSKEFSSRIEYDKHCLTLIHMKNAVRYEEECKNHLAKEAAKVRSIEKEKDVCHENKNGKNLSEQEYILDIKENLNEQNLRMPSYKYCRQNQICIGKSMVKKAQGFYCERCRRFMFRAEDRDAHLRSITHYESFVAEIKSLTRNTATIETNEDEVMENMTDISKNTEECEKSYQNVETKEIVKVEPSIKDMNMQEDIIKEEKYDLLEINIELEEDKSYQQESNANTLNKDSSIDGMDIDNEIDNFINDTNKKEFMNLKKSTPKMDQNSQVKSSKYSEISGCELYTRRPQR